jgi:hypothetical protein
MAVDIVVEPNLNDCCRTQILKAKGDRELDASSGEEISKLSSSLSWVEELP